MTPWKLPWIRRESISSKDRHFRFPNTFFQAFSKASPDFRFRVHGWSLSGKATYPFDDDISVFVRVGAFQYQVTEASNSTRQDITVFPAREFSNSSPNTTSSSQATFGIGAEYSLTSTWALRLAWDEYMNIGNKATTDGNIQVVSPGLLGRF